MSPIEEMVKTVISKTMTGEEGIDPQVINSANIHEHLGLDSLDAVEIIMTLEEKLDSEFPESEINWLEENPTVGCFIDAVNRMVDHAN